MGRQLRQLRPVLAQSPGVGQGQRHQVLGLELPQAARRSHSRFAERSSASVRQQSDASSVGTGCQLWLLRKLGVLWSPVTISTSGFRAVTRGIDRVELLDPLHLLVEVAVLAGAVGVLEVDEEEVVVVPMLFEHVDLFVQRLGLPTISMPTSWASPLYIG